MPAWGFRRGGKPSRPLKTSRRKRRHLVGVAGASRIAGFREGMPRRLPDAALRGRPAHHINAIRQISRMPLATKPPSTGRMCPVTYDASSDARKLTAPAISAGWP